MPAPVITALKEIFGREFSDETQQARAVRIFRVSMDQDCYWMSSVMDATGAYVIPALGQIYNPDRPELRCVSREIAEIGRSLREFTVTLRYDRYPYNLWDVKITSQEVEAVLDVTAETTVGVGMPQRFTANPGMYLTTQPVGAKGEIVQNRAKDAFDPSVMGHRTQQVITAEIMVDDIADLGFASVGELTGLAGKVNSERIQIFSIPDESTMGCDYWSLLLEEVAVNKVQTPTGCALAVALRIIYDPLGHCPVVLNAGYNELVNSGAPEEVRRKCRNADQSEVSSPAVLDAIGRQVSPVNLPAQTTYIIAPSRETFNFTALGLPTLFCGAVPTPPP